MIKSKDASDLSDIHQQSTTNGSNTKSNVKLFCENKSDNYAISWNNIFYEVNDLERRVNLINKFFRKEKLKENDTYGDKTNEDTHRKPHKKIILNNISGCLRSSKLMGIIGPSGVGKSSLLEIISGRRKHNVKGNVYLHAAEEKNLKFSKFNKLSFIPQNDNHIENLTVKETLIYASKLKNEERARELVEQNINFNQDNNLTNTISLSNTSPTNSSIDTIYSTNSSSSTSSSFIKSSNYNNPSLINLNFSRHFNKKESNHSNSTNFDTLKVSMANDKQASIWLNITQVNQYHEYLVEEIINELMLDNCSENFVTKCSGGQLKRLSIALELLSQPKVIIIDEPTTGLDFSSALNCIQILKNLTVNNSDPPAIIVSIHQPSSSVIKLFDRLYVLARGGVCIYNGNTTNLVDYLNKFQFDCPLYFNPCDLLIQISSGECGEKRFKDMINHQSLVTKQEIIKETWSLKYKYDLSKLIKDLDIKKSNRLSQIKLLIERDIKNSSRRPLLNILRFFYFSFFAFFIYFTYNYEIGTFNGCYSELVDSSNYLNQLNYAQKLAKLSDNSSMLFFITMFLVISSIMPAALTFPVEISTFIKERSNCWYSAFTYYIAKFIADLPSYVIFPIIFTSLFYPLTNQIGSTERFLWFNIIVILNSLITRSIGMVIGSIFLNDTLSAVFVSTCAIFPFMLTAGFLIRASVSTWILKPFWYFGFIRYTFGSLLIIVYGWGRCMSPNSTFNRTIDMEESDNQLMSNLALSGLKNLMNNYLKPNEMKCLVSENQASNFSLFTDLINECEINMNQIKSSMISNLAKNNLEKYDYSFILNYFELTNEHFSIYVLNLILIFFTLTIVNYWILLYKIKKCSQF